MEAGPPGRGPGGNRHPVGSLCPSGQPGPDYFGRGAGGQLQVGKRPPVPRQGCGQIPLREEQSPAGAGLGHAVGGDHVPGSNGPDRAVPVKQQVQPKGAAPGADCGPERGAAPGQRGGRQLRFAP